MRVSTAMLGELAVDSGLEFLMEAEIVLRSPSPPPPPLTHSSTSSGTTMAAVKVSMLCKESGNDRGSAAKSGELAIDVDKGTIVSSRASIPKRFPASCQSLRFEDARVPLYLERISKSDPFLYSFNQYLFLKTMDKVT